MSDGYSQKTEDFVMSKEDLNDLKGHIKWCRTRIALQSEEQRDTKTKLDGNNIRANQFEEHVKEMSVFVV